MLSVPHLRRMAVGIDCPHELLYYCQMQDLGDCNDSLVESELFQIGQTLTLKW